MIDLNNLKAYRENNRIEAKKALGGLPHSIWETYSAFANALGGIILLGVEEYRDKTLHTVDLPDPEKLVREFWELVNDPKMASVNILSQRDVTIETVNGDRIIVITVPPADRTQRPVYVEGNPLNTYLRNGEGDYRCTREEYQAMVRDASVRTPDAQLLEAMDPGVFRSESIWAYRARMRLSRPGHQWEGLTDADFLLRLGAAGIGPDGDLHPTSAGLLMFGSEHDIVREYPRYFLDYRDERSGERLMSSSGDWSGNLFDFCFRVCERLLSDRELSGTPVAGALREALANCFVNADYYGRGGLVILRRQDEITLANPGAFRIDVDAARRGGLSDPRNGAIQKMFNLLDLGEHTGSGIPSIFRIWREQGWAEPGIIQSFDPARTLLRLPLKPAARKRAILSGDGGAPAVRAVKRQMLIDYLTDHASARPAELAAHVGLKPSSVRSYLAELVAGDIAVAEGTGRNRIYRLKA